MELDVSVTEGTCCREVVHTSWLKMGHEAQVGSSGGKGVRAADLIGCPRFNHSGQGRWRKASGSGGGRDEGETHKHTHTQAHLPGLITLPAE